jgi:hypothetical protein
LDRGPLAGFDPLVNPFLQLLPEILQAQPALAAAIPEGIKRFISQLNEPGIQDLRPDCAVITDIKTKLPGINIPVLLIRAKKKQSTPPGGGGGYMDLLNNLLGADNDGLISWESQDLQGAGAAPKAINTNIERTGFQHNDENEFLHGFSITDTLLVTYYAKFLAKVKSCIAS